jgi:rhamnogalacturonyl hydrolase YesR
MAPPTFVRLAKATGDPKYNELMCQLWCDSRGFLYDEEENLFYRDKNFFPDKKRTRNGKKVFWSRGNGWVLGGLARVLECLPADDPHRPEFVDLFRAVSAKVASLQGPDGLWRASLLDYDEWPMPETSGTGLYCFAMAWGVNNGLLDGATYVPVVKKAWEGLNRMVNDEGCLGWVQFVAAAPGPVSPDTMREYAPGAFLLSAGEILRLLGEDGPKE